MILINIKRVRLRHSNWKVKTKEPEQLATPSCLLLDVKVTTRLSTFQGYLHPPFPLSCYQAPRLLGWVEGQKE
jgi:hypothetical protein